MKQRIARWGATAKQNLVDMARSRQARGFVISILVMAAVSLAFFFPDNFEGNDLRQHDMVQGYANGEEISRFEAETGEKSWWTNSLFSGMPTFQISPSYASNSLFAWVTKVYGLGLPAPSNLLFMMMVGFMILMMALRVRWEYGLIGAIAWGLSSYFVIIIGAGHIWKFVTLAYIPPTIAGIIVAYRGRFIAGGAIAAFFAMMQIASNHVQMTYYFGFLIAALIVAYLIGAARKGQLATWLKATGVLLAAAALAIAANLPNLYHTSKYAKETQRAASELAAETGDDGIDRDYITQYSYGRAETFTLLIPNVKGGATMKPVKGRPSLVSLGQLDGASEAGSDIRQLLNRLPQYFGEPEPTNGPVYVGVIIFALFLLGCFTVGGPLKWALVVATVLSILLAWGRNAMGLTDLFLDWVPMYSKFRTPESILVIAQFTMPLLGVLALVKLVKGRDEAPAEPKRAAVPWLEVTFGVVAAFCLVGVLFPGIYGSEDDLSRQLLDMSAQEPAYMRAYNAVIDLRHGMVAADSLRSLIYLLLAYGALKLWQRRVIKAVWFPAAAIGVLVLVDLYTADKRYLSHDSFVETSGMEQTRVTPSEADRIILQDRDPHYRVLDLDRFGSAEPSYFHKMIGGYHAAKLGRYQDMIERHIYRLETETDYDVVNMLNARYLVYNGQVMENPDAMGNVWWIDAVDFVDGANAEMDALDRTDLRHAAVADRRFAEALGHVRPHTPGDTIYLTSYAPNRLTYRAKTANGATAAFSEVYFPWGWEATIDGNMVPIARVNYLLRALTIPAGDHEVVMTFAPRSVKTTETIAVVAIVLIYLWAIFALGFGVKKKKGSEPLVESFDD